MYFLGSNSTHCLRILTLGLVYSCAECCCSTRLYSFHDSKINDELDKIMRIITNTISLTLLIWLPALSKTALPTIRRRGILRAIFDRVLHSSEVPLHHDVQNDQIQRLKFRKSFNQHNGRITF